MFKTISTEGQKLLDKYNMTIEDLDGKLRLYGMLHNHRFSCENCILASEMHHKSACICIISNQKNYRGICLTRMFPHEK